MIARALAALALAFVLPGSVLLRQYAERRSEELEGNVRVSGTLSLWGDDARAFAQRTGMPLGGDAQDHLEIFAQLTLGPQRCTLDLGLVDQPLGRLINDGGRLQGADPASASGLAGAMALVTDGCVPFLWRGADGAEGLAGFLQLHGGNPREVAFTRFDGSVAYAIGGPANGSGSAALVISKGSLRPLRLLVRETARETEGEKALIDVHYGEYRSVGPAGVPGRISVTRGGAPLAAFAVQLPAR